MSKKADSKAADAKSTPDTKTLVNKKPATGAVGSPAAAAQPVLNVTKDLAVSERGLRWMFVVNRCVY
jgi:hypothetical protein